jgi:hypothetical protein
VRCWESQPNDREAFAHTAPWHFSVANKPSRPRQAEINWLIERTQAEIDRNRNVLSDAAIDEFRHALREYQAISTRAQK